MAKRSRSFKDKAMIVLSVVLCIVALIGILVAFFWNSKIFSGANGGVVNIDGLSGKKMAGNLQKSDNLSENTLDGVENFLICGLDESEQLTDIIMLASVNFDTGEVNVLQIPRDSYIGKEFSRTGKINAAYSNKSGSLTPINRLINVINQQFKLRVDHYATVTISSFRKIIDAIGGVPIDIPFLIGDEEYGIIPAGYQILDGEKAEWLVRHRHSYYDQDIGRMKVQRLFLAALVEKIKTIGAKEAMNLLPIIYGSVTTDLTLGNISKYLPFAFNVDMGSIKIFIAPGEGTTYSGQSVWGLHKYETADLLNSNFRWGKGDVDANQLNIQEIVHTVSYYDNTQDNFEGLIEGDIPGKRKDDESSTGTVYTHVVTVTTKKPQTMPPPTTYESETLYPEPVEGSQPPQGMPLDPEYSYVPVETAQTIAPVTPQQTTAVPTETTAITTPPSSPPAMEQPNTAKTTTVYIRKGRVPGMS